MANADARHQALRGSPTRDHDSCARSPRGKLKVILSVDQLGFGEKKASLTRFHLVFLEKCLHFLPCLIAIK